MMEEVVILNQRRNLRFFLFIIISIIFVSCRIKNNDDIFCIKKENINVKILTTSNDNCKNFTINKYTQQRICNNNENILIIKNLNYDLIKLLKIEEGDVDGRYIYINNTYHFRYRDINYLIYEFDISNINRSKNDIGFYYLFLFEQNFNELKKIEINTYLSQHDVKSIFVIDNRLFFYDIENSQVYILNHYTFEKYKEKESKSLKKIINKLRNDRYKIIINPSYYIQYGGD